MDDSIRESGTYVFGPYRLDSSRRILTRDGRQVDLTPRLFDTLAYLVENHEKLVEREALERAVWGERSVAVSNLGKAISDLRRVLQVEGINGNIIVTVPGRGFRLGILVVFEPTPTGNTVPLGAASADRTTASRPSTRSLWRLGLWLGFAALVVSLSAGVAVVVAVRHAPPPVTLPEFTPPPHSVAVLAFSNLSGDPAQEYFSDGLSEELIDSLSRIGSLHVAARLSAFSFKNKNVTIQEICRALNVGKIVEGSVRRDGARLRITAQLIDGVTGYQLWSQSYDRDEGDIFRVQGELALAVASSLQVNLAGVDLARLTLGGTNNPKALDAYLRAVAAVQMPDETLTQAKAIIAAFDTAVALDPRFAAAQAERGMALWHIALSNTELDTAAAQQMKDDALASARRAVTLAPDLALAHLALGQTLDNSLPDFARQEAEFVRARELAPGSAEIARQYGRFEVLAGHTALGVAAAEQAAALDATTPVTYNLLAGTLYFAARDDAALAALRHAAALGAPESIFSTTLTGLIALARGDAAAARVSCSKKANWQTDLCLAIADHALGRRTEADADLARLRAGLGESGAYNYAQVYAQWGEPDVALRWIETAYRSRDTALIQLRADPLLDPIRQAPRFQEILRLLGFPA